MGYRGPVTSDRVGVLPLLGPPELATIPLHGRPLVLHGIEALAEVAEDLVIVLPADGDHLGRTIGQLVADAAHLQPRMCGPDDWSDGLRGQVLVHDPRCPLTPSGFVRSLAERHAADPAVALAACRPVTDTVKTSRDERVEGTVDRERLAVITSPVVFQFGDRDSADVPPLGDFAALVAWLRQRGEVELVKGPSMGRRVDDASSVSLLECLDEVGRLVR